MAHGELSSVWTSCRAMRRGRTDGQKIQHLLTLPPHFLHTSPPIHNSLEVRLRGPVGSDGVDVGGARPAVRHPPRRAQHTLVGAASMQGHRHGGRCESESLVHTPHPLIPHTQRNTWAIGGQEAGLLISVLLVCRHPPTHMSFSHPYRLLGRMLQRNREGRRHPKGAKSVCVLQSNEAPKKGA